MRRLKLSKQAEYIKKEFSEISDDDINELDIEIKKQMQERKKVEVKKYINQYTEKQLQQYCNEKNSKEFKSKVDKIIDVYWENDRIFNLQEGWFGILAYLLTQGTIIEKIVHKLTNIQAGDCFYFSEYMIVVTIWWLFCKTEYFKSKKIEKFINEFNSVSASLSVLEMLTFYLAVLVQTSVCVWGAIGIFWTVIIIVVVKNRSRKNSISSKGDLKNKREERLIEIETGKIQNAPEEYGVDAIVNSACPTVMGSDSKVDSAIHLEIDKKNGKSGFFKERIKEQFKEKLGTDKENILRCSSGEAVITKGYKLCHYIIHTVGPKSDKNIGKCTGTYSSSCVEKLAECYQNIMNLVFENPEIEKIAIPVISAGKQEFDFKYAFTIGLTTVHNILLEKKKEQGELFKYIGLKKVYFIIPNKANYTIANNVYKRYEKTFDKEHRAVSAGVWKSQKEFWKELSLYDNQKGYFTIVKGFRRVLLFLRIYILGTWTYMKDIVSKEDWIVRRQVAEFTSLAKLIVPIVLIYCLNLIHGNFILNVISVVIVVYDVLDTITYLLFLMFLADIQRPSANVSRSLIMLVVNYIEVQLDMACIWMISCYFKKSYVTIKMVIEFIMGGNTVETFQWLKWVNNGIKFFFITIVLSYFSSHMRQRKFRTY